MKKVFLKNARRYAIIDSTDVKLVSRYHWWMHHSGYAVTKIWRGGKRRDLSMHRLLMGCPPGVEVDHRDQNKRNNRRANLRLATAQQNRRNVSRRANNSSGSTGVWHYKRIDRWVAGIGKPRIHLGTFRTRSEAIKAYRRAAKRLFKEFTCFK